MSSSALKRWATPYWRLREQRTCRGVKVALLMPVETVFAQKQYSPSNRISGLFTRPACSFV
eukprot:6407187-Prymnesium_polylepis.1